MGKERSRQLVGARDSRKKKEAWALMQGGERNEVWATAICCGPCVLGFVGLEEKTGQRGGPIAGADGLGRTRTSSRKRGARLGESKDGQRMNRESTPGCRLDRWRERAAGLGLALAW